jgi:hypothetical protein
MWQDIAFPLGAEPRQADLIEQADAHRRLLDATLAGKAAGCFAVCQGRRTGHPSYGERSVLAPSGLWRPVGEVFRHFSNRLRGERNVPRVWQGREMDRDSDARGVTALWREWRRVENRRPEDEEIRPVGFRRPSTEMVARIPNRAGPRFANAEWGEVWLRGRPLARKPGAVATVDVGDTLSLEIINTGPATWEVSGSERAGLVRLRASHPKRRPTTLKVRGLAYGERDVLQWTATEVGRWSLQAHQANRGPFGERLIVDVAPQRVRVRSPAIP